MVRYHRMKGRPTLWLPGTDHAGIATQVHFNFLANFVFCGDTSKSLFFNLFVLLQTTFNCEQIFIFS